jgi:hypothetical protein
LPRGKRNIHDSGTHVPLIIRFPQRWAHLAPAQPGEWIEEPVSFVDFPATLLSLAGVPVPAYYEGRPFLGQQRAAPREDVFLFRDRMDERYDMVRAIRNPGFRYVRNFSPHRPWGQRYTYAFRVQPGMRSWHAEFEAGRCDAVQSAYWGAKPSEELYEIARDSFEIENLAARSEHRERLAAMRQRLREVILGSRDTGFVPEGMLTRMAGDRPAYEFARSDAYPLERILPMAERATARDIAALPDLIAALEDPHPAIRYWAALGCLVLENRAAPAKESLRARLNDDWADVRVAAAEAMAWLGEPKAALDTLGDVLATGNLYEVLAAQNALEYVWRAGHIPLDAAQTLLRARDFPEPAQRIPEFLSGLSTDTAPQAASGEVFSGFQLAIAEFNWLECDDCDGVALGDISGNGKTDLLMSNGKGGETFWYEQDATPYEWTRHHIFTIPGPRREIEGNDLGDFNGDGQLEAVSLDQPNGVIYLHAHDGDPRGIWRTVALQTGRPLVQASLVTDVDGDGRPDLIYTWEGRQVGTGGVHWLRFSGTDLLDPAHWEEHVLVQHESAWWLAPRRLDLNGNGRATDVVFTARNLKARNPGARPGVYWLEEPPNPTERTRPWQRHTIDDTLNHPLHVDVGDLSGHRHGRDVVVGGFDTHHVYWYSFSEGWKRHALPLPALEGELPDKVWNVKTTRFSGARDGILAAVTGDRKGALLHFEFAGERYEPNLLKRIDYGHPMDDRIVLHDLDGDGLEEAFIPDSGTGVSRFVWIKFRWTP